MYTLTTEMDLNDQPSKRKLAGLLTRCDDNAGYHILWVDTHGKMKISLISDPKLIAWEEKLFQFRTSPWAPDSGSVGENAANNNAWVARIFDYAVRYWGTKDSGIIDLYL